MKTLKNAYVGEKIKSSNSNIATAQFKLQVSSYWEKTDYNLQILIKKY